MKNGYPPQYSPEIFNKVMDQVENFEENSDVIDYKEGYVDEYVNGPINHGYISNAAEEKPKYGD